MRRGLAAAALLVATPGLGLGWAQPSAAQVSVGERPALEYHLEQADIDAGDYRLDELMRYGQRVFDARFNKLDGQGRPGSTGTGAPRRADQPAFVRTSAPESNSCMGCHAQPRSGGAGDVVANVFVLAQALDPVTYSVEARFSNERNTLGMFGAGAIEMLAREMSADLIGIREAARGEAARRGRAVSRRLHSKGVDFGRIRVLPDGRVDPSEIEGVDWDLIVKPFHQKGAVVSIREFTNNAMNHHHGMQSSERFGDGVDADGDGVADELSRGDITAATLFQATLPVPGRQHSAYEERRRAARRGERVFSAIGCDSCHRPALVLNRRHFSEPNPFNPEGNLRPEDVDAPFVFDLTHPAIGLERRRGGGAIVRAFTDLKRYDLNDAELDHFANEQLSQGSLVGFADPAEFTIPPQPRPTREFLTRKLWDAGDSDPYGHRGDLTTLTEAIHFHGGDARRERDAYFALPEADQDAVIEFLKSLVMEPRVERSAKQKGQKRKDKNGKGRKQRG